MQLQGKFLETLRSRLSLAEIIGAKVKLTRKGREFSGLCPFHHEKTPSFTVNEEKEFYHCFGCGAHGDGIRFLMEAQNYTFMEAVKELAGRVGLPLPQEISSAETEPQEDLAPLKAALQEASAWFQKNLFHAKGTNALRYAEKRGLSRETLKKFSLGYALEGRHTLETYLKEKGFSTDVLVKSGLSVQGEPGSTPYDRFRQRFMFPIQDARGNMVGFGGRLLEAGEPKYLNSPETPLFSKGKLLYGYVHAREKSAADPLLIVEGYMDVISLQQAGFKGAVAPLGTALTEDQILLSWRLAPDPILCFDGDGAGLKAAARAAERVLPLLKPGYSLRFVFLPHGEDPDSLVKKEPLFKNLLEKPHSLLEALWIFLTNGKSFKTPEQKAALQKQCAVWCKAMTHSDVRKNYQYAFSDLFYKEIVGKKAKTLPVSAVKKGPLNFLLIHERLLLAILINHPTLIRETSDDLASLDFTDPRLHEMRDGMLKIYADDILDEMPVKDYLLQEGFEEEVETLLSPHLLVHGAFAKSSAPLEDARQGWKEIFNRVQQTLGKHDLTLAQQDLAEEMSEKAWQRLKMLKKNTLNQD